ncbi:MAG: GrdX family protein [Fretibacterium sp.]|nr:GrdX family protein [Fretibacterium sp.]
MLAVSNNPLVLEHAKETGHPVEGTPLDVLYKVLELLATGEYKLLAHPIAGNERLLRNPFRTVLLDFSGPPGEQPLSQQLAYVNRALYKMEQIDYSSTPPNTLEDYRAVDYQLYLGALPPLAG